MTSSAANPFEAPRAAINDAGADASTEAEAIRQAYLPFERSTMTVAGYFFLMAGTFGVIGLTFTLAAVRWLLLGRGELEPGPPLIASIVFAVVSTGFGLGAASIGVGLRKLRPWARRVALGVFGLFALMFAALVVGLIGYVIYDPPPMEPGLLGFSLYALPIGAVAYVIRVLMRAEARVIFSPEYREIVAATPRIRARSSVVMKICYGLLALFGLMTIAGVIMSFWR